MVILDSNSASTTKPFTEFIKSQTQYKQTGHRQNYKDLLSWLILVLFQRTTASKIDSE